MQIMLCRILNISRENTPCFAQRSHQQSYFNSKKVKTITTTFYPPYYNNEIKVDTDDYTFDSGINYLYFNYNNRDYYYFIDNVEFLNENVVVLHVTMDTVQTYYFDCFVTGELERYTPPRWIDNKINRDYIRENLSEGDFRIRDYKFLTNRDWKTGDSNIFGWIIIKASSDLPTYNDEGYGNSYGVNGYVKVLLPNVPEAYERYYSGYKYYFVPIIGTQAQRVKITGQNGAGQIVDYEINYSDFISSVGKLTQVVDIYFIPGQILKPEYFDSISYANNRITIHDPDPADPSADEHFRISSYFGIALNAGESDLSIITRNLELEITNINGIMPNGASNNWQPEVEVAMLDENYIRVSFGEFAADTTYPLYQLTTIGIKCEYWADIFSGTRYYQILGDTEYYSYQENPYRPSFGMFPDPYRVCTSAANKLNYDLLTDPYIQWQDYNKSSIAMAFVGLAVSAITKGMVANYASQDNYQEISDIKGAPKSYDNRYTTRSQFDRPLKKASQARISGLERDNAKIKSQQVATAASSSGSLLSTATSYYNAWLAPDSPKQFGNLNNDFMDNSCAQQYSIYTVNDYNSAALYYHMNGYKTSKYVVSNSLYFANYNAREYFNVIKFSFVTVGFQSSGNPDTGVILDIQSRLLNGLRFWKYDSNTTRTKTYIGNFSVANW